MSSPYEVLGVDPDADDGVVRRAYRERVKEAHPDHGGSAEEFRAVRTAYERIKAGDVPDEDESEPATSDNEWVRGSRTGQWETEQSAAAGEQAESEEDERYRVEYLNYEVFDDFGWDIGDDDLFEQAGEADLDPIDYGELIIDEDQTLLEAAEAHGFAWPFACRGGACSNCAVAVVDGDVPTSTGHILTQELLDQGIRLSCVAKPITSDAKVVYNVKHLPGVSELLLPASRFERAQSD